MEPGQASPSKRPARSPIFQSRMRGEAKLERVVKRSEEDLVRSKSAIDNCKSQNSCPSY